MKSKKPAFHNPYNFVPAPDRDDLAESPLGDHLPAGHHRYEPELLSGQIRVRMVCETPLLNVDAARARERGKHRSFPVRTLVDGRPLIAATSVKGMLRAAYEAVTNSRMAVFEKHKDRLAYRMPAERQQTTPARVIEKGGKLYFQTLKEVSLPCYKGREVLLPEGRKPEHEQEVWIKLNEKGTKVDEICPATPVPQDTSQLYRGWVRLSGQNINGKTCERVFYELKQKGKDGLKPVLDEAKELWRGIVKNYQEIHQKELEQRRAEGIALDAYLGDEPGKTAFSRHIYSDDQKELREGILCYLEKREEKIVGVFPVIFSRKLFKDSPEALLPESLKPATDLGRLSPADRIFGWVGQDGQGGYRGHLRVGEVRCLDQGSVEHFSGDGLPLAILAEPKPQQGRFYVAEDSTGSAQKDGLKTEEAGYIRGNGLRGRKVYPHHKGLPEGHWKKSCEDRTQRERGGHCQEYRRPKSGDEEQRDSQNRSIDGWIRPGTRFNIELTLDNFSECEVGALVWLLTRPKGHFHRLGGGKPLGFGSVHLEIIDADLRDGRAWVEHYLSLGRSAKEEGVRFGLGELERLSACFECEVEKAYGAGKAFKDVPFIAAFSRAMTGHPDELPVHYPRVTQAPSPEGESFKWFVENQRVGGPGHALPDLATDSGMPLFTEEGGSVKKSGKACAAGKPEKSLPKKLQGEKKELKAGMTNKGYRLGR
jgi:CRISPR-associated protein (TIGR03986 family)